MKFNIVTQTFAPTVGGMQFVMTSLAKALRAHGEVIVFPDAAARIPDLKCIHTPMIKPYRHLLKRLNLWRSLTPSDTIICDSWKSLNALPTFHGKVVVLAHGQEFIVQREKKQMRINRLLKKATHLVASSHDTLQRATTSFDLSHLKTCVIAPTYGLSSTSLPSKDTSNQKIKLLSVCRLEERKGLQFALKALSHYRNKPEFDWHIIGDGEFKCTLQSLIQELGMTNTVHLHGRMSDEEKQKMYQIADLFVMPSYQSGSSIEGFGISYAEAAQYGIPSIAGIDGGVKDAVIDGLTGWCTNPKDTNGLRATLEIAMTDHQLRLQLGFNAKAYYTENFAGSVVLEKLINHIEHAHA